MKKQIILTFTKFCSFESQDMFKVLHSSPLAINLNSLGLCISHWKISHTSRQYSLTASNETVHNDFENDAVETFLS